MNQSSSGSRSAPASDRAGCAPGDQSARCGRRGFLGAGIGAALLPTLASAAGPQDQPPGTGIVVVSRDRILRDAAAAQRLRQAELELTQRMQAQIDDHKAAFAAEEEELAGLRGRLPDAQFDARVSDFDRRVRVARREAQERASILQKGFQDARAEIVAALPPLMERLRIEAGATVVLNADQTLALDPAIDLTERAIALFDAEGPSPEPPEIGLDSPG